MGPLWALMSGTRPSDGVFVLPCLLVLLVKKPIQTKIVFLLTALPVALLWYVPTVHHFGGHLMSPLSAAGTQVHKLANGLFVSGVSWRRKIGNLVHIALGALNAWNILTPFILIGLFTTARISRVVLLWCLPGFLFYVLYFFSDSTYLAFMIAPGLLAGGLILQQLSKKRASLVLACAIVFSVVQMIAMRPVSVTGAGTAILNAYSLKYSDWGLKHQYAARLADLIGFPE